DPVDTMSPPCGPSASRNQGTVDSTGLGSGAPLSRRDLISPAERSLDRAVVLVLLQGLPLVVELLPLGRPEEHLAVPALPVELERHDREPLGLRRLGEPLDLAAVEEQPPRAVGDVLGVAGVRVGRDRHAEEARLAVVDARVGLVERDLAVAERLHLAPREDEARLDLLDDEVVVERLLVPRDDLLAVVVRP